MRWLLLPLTGAFCGGQLLILGHPLLGLLLVAWAVYKALRMKWSVVLLAAALGVGSGLYEVHLTANPPLPAGAITVQPTAWRVMDGFAIYTGTAANGVSVSGSANLDEHQQAALTNIAVPVRVQTTDQPQRIEPARNMYEFDYQAYSWAQYHRAYQIKSKKMDYTPFTVRTVTDWLQNLRLRLLMRIDAMPRVVARYTKALLLGIMDDDMAGMRDVFGKLGIIHLFSVSGLHIFAVVGLLYGLTNRLRIPAEYVDWFLLALLPMLLVIIPPGAGLIRAVWMRFLQVLGTRLHLNLSTLDCFCLVLMGNLWVQPRVLTTLGGQLTYLLTLMLIVFTQDSRFKQSVVMALVSTPALLCSIYGVHLLTFVFNWLLMPIFESVLMPILVAGLLWPQCPLLQGVDVLLVHFERLMTWLAKLPGYWNFGALPGIIAIVLTILVARALVTQRWRIPVATLVVAYLVVNVHCGWRVVVIDVGQGDSILIEAPFKRATVLIDTGGRGFGTSMNPPAKRATLNYLAARGITKLDALVLTHQDADHVGDAPIITQGVKVTEIVTTEFAASTDVVQRARTGGVPPIHTVMAGDQLDYGPLSLRVVAPNHINPDDTNPNSVVLYGKIGGENWLFTGDADRQVDTEQLQPQNLHVDYLKVEHHGSKTGSDPKFIEQIHPRAGFISAGVNNRYGHPNQETLATFAQLRIPLIMTNQVGMIWVDDYLGQSSIHGFLNER